MAYKRSRIAVTKLSLSVALALAAMGSTPASAINLDTGNPDATLRWDNTVRYNLGWRMEKVNPVYANAFGSDETETVFKKNDLIMNRLDLLSELDYVWKAENQLTYGFRVSGAAWSENAYPSHSRTNPDIAAYYASLPFPFSLTPPPISNYGAGGQWSKYAKRYVTGSSGEFLDAFVFGAFNLGETTLNLKVGQHNVYWGQTLYSVADGISAGQQALDGLKAAVSPGAEVKELFMPLNQISATWSLNEHWALIGQYQLDWKPFRVSPAGTFFGSGDASGSLLGSDPYCAATFPGGGCLRNLDAVTPSGNGGSWGLGAKWTPGNNDTWGFYYRKYDEKLPWGARQIDPAFFPAQADLSLMGIRLNYARDTELWGMSLDKQIWGLSTGIDFSYRKNTALNSTTGVVILPMNMTPTYEQLEGARGDTYHLVINAISLLDKTALYETGNLQGELAYQRLDKVTKNPTRYYSMDNACKGTANNKSNGCATKDALALNLGATLQWLNVLPSVDLSLPLSYSVGLSGNAPTIGGSSEKQYSWSVGLTAMYRTLYEFSLLYSDKHADYTAAPDTGITGINSTPATGNPSSGAGIGNNHGWLNLRFKTSF